MSYFLSVVCPYCYTGTHYLQGGREYWVPRIRLLFLAEDPRVFVERVQFACNYRAETEALIIYNLYVDSMPISEETTSLNTNKNIEICSISAAGPSSEM